MILPLISNDFLPPFSLQIAHNFWLGSAEFSNLFESLCWFWVLSIPQVLSSCLFDRWDSGFKTAYYMSTETSSVQKFNALSSRLRIRVLKRRKCYDRTKKIVQLTCSQQLFCHPNRFWQILLPMKRETTSIILGNRMGLIPGGFPQLGIEINRISVDTIRRGSGLHWRQ